MGIDMIEILGVNPTQNDEQLSDQFSPSCKISSNSIYHHLAEDVHQADAILKVCVIGAGSAGLCALRHLSQYPGKFDITAYEQAEDVGGTWIYNGNVGHDRWNLPIHSSMYENLRTNIPLCVMEYPDFKTPNEEGAGFVGHKQVLSYLQNYAQHYNVRKLVKFNHHIQMISRKNKRWEMQVLDLNRNETIVNKYDLIFVCVGRYSLPRVPVKIDTLIRDAEFCGKIMHSHDYRKPQVFSGQNVIIIGAGPSGIDMTVEISKHANSVYVLHNLPRKYQDLPENVEQFNGSICKVQQLNDCNDNLFTLTSGQVLKGIHTVIYATGYDYNFQIFDASCKLDVTVSHEQVRNLYLHYINASNPTMAILGIPQRIIPFRVFHQQMAYYMKWIFGSAALATEAEMIKHCEMDFNQKIKAGYPPRHAHKMVTDDDNWVYDDLLCDLAGIPPISPVIRTIYDYLNGIRAKCSQTYRDLCFKILDDHSYKMTNCYDDKTCK